MHIFDGPNRFPKVSPQFPPNVISILENQIGGVECFFWCLIAKNIFCPKPTPHLPSRHFFAGRPPPAPEGGGLPRLPLLGSKEILKKGLKNFFYPNCRVFARREGVGLSEVSPPPPPAHPKSLRCLGGGEGRIAIHPHPNLRERVRNQSSSK